MHKALRTALFLIFAVLAGVVLTPGNAFAETPGNIGDDITYTIEDGTMTISGNGAMQNYDNPSFRPYDEQAGDITEVVIEDGVTSIGDHAFISCYNLTSIEIPESVTSIGGNAFSDCASLASITIPDSVTSIGEGAFGYCESLTSIEIPEKVTSISKTAFGYCKSLEAVTIPESVTSIGNGAFNGCTSLASVTIPESVTSIGRNAFNECTSLESVTIPNGIASINDYMFSGCSSLKSVTIPDSVTSIGESAFTRCYGLTSIELPEGLKSIGEGAFWKCIRLISITIPSSVTSIGQEAFFGCEVLKSVTIPEGVSIGDRAFSNCEGLETVILPEGLVLGGNTGVTESATKITYTVSDGNVTITGVTLGADKEKVEIDDTVSGMPVVGVGKEIRDKVSIPGHDHQGGTADCTHKAECVICGEEYGEMLPHVIVPVREEVLPTCTEKGMTAGKKCSVCKTVLVAPAEIPATGQHSFANGKCMVCGADDPDYKPEEKPEEKPGDKPGEEPGNKPDEKPGGTTHTHSAQGGWQYDSGSHWKTCGCGEVLERENHDLEWVIDRKPTEEEEGLRHRECSVCGYAGAEVSIPALGTEKEAQPDGEEADALPEEPAETEETGSDAGEYTDNPGTGGASPVHALLLAAGALGALLWLRKRRG